MGLLAAGIEAMERGWIPDRLTRYAIRYFCRQRLRESSKPNSREFLDSLHTGPIALVPDLANAQHYELPAEFFQIILGPHLKYSCCYFDSENATLADAEETALLKTIQHAELVDGQTILELGCGWGSLSLFMAARFPHSEITAISNSRFQREFIENEIQKRGLHNLRILTCDMNTFSPGKQQYDRVVSVEMFEHMRNYERLLELIATWLRPQGKLFIHIFCHRELNYPFETQGEENWMGRHFFSGGMMPSADLLRRFDRSLKVSEQQSWNGKHYQHTAELWLKSLDAQRSQIIPLLRATYGPQEATRQFQRWRVFFLAVSELFGFNEGEEWYVSHYLLEHAS